MKLGVSNDEGGGGALKDMPGVHSHLRFAWIPNNQREQASAMRLDSLYCQIEGSARKKPDLSQTENGVQQ